MAARSPTDKDRSKMANEDGLILTAIMNNDKHYLIELLVQGCSPMGDESKPEVTTPLDLAINLQNLDMVKILLRYGAWMKSTMCTLNPTALHCAALNRQKAIIRQLIKNKVDWSSTDGDGATVLHMVFELDETSAEDEDIEEHDNDDNEDVDADDDDAAAGEEPPTSKRKMTKIDYNVEQEIIEIITIFLNVGANVNAETNTGETPLFLALKKGMIEVAGFLIERGANVHVRDNMGNSLIHLLINDEVEEPAFDEDLGVDSYAQKNNATFVNWLLSKGVNANYKNARGEMPLQLAIEYKLRDTLLVLLKHANVHYVNDEAESWLHVFLKMYQGMQGAPASTSASASIAAAASTSETEFLTIAEMNEIVRDLVRRGVPVNGVDRYGQTLFHAAIQLRNTRVLRSIAERFVNVLACNSEGETVLHALVSRCIDDERENEEGYAEIARILMARGANADRKDKRGLSALHLAAQYKYAKLVRAFKEGGADASARTADGDTLLHLVAGRLASVRDESADRALVELALAHGCEANAVKPKGGWTALHVAASCGNLAVTRCLLERGAKVDQCNDDGYTPLHLAALGRCPRTLELLVRGGADANAKSRDGATPLHWLCNSTAPELAVAERLIALGADVSARERRERASALHVAVRRAQPAELLRLLAQHGADLDARLATTGDTALHEAARLATSPDYHAIPTLLGLGARAQLTNRQALTPLHCAILGNCAAGFYLLLKYAVDLDDIPQNVRSIVLANRDMSVHVIDHLAKLQAANLIGPELAREQAFRADASACDDASVNFAADSSILEQLSNNNDKYKQEVEAMKAYAIDQRVSLYDVLHMQPSRRFAYLKNVSFDLADFETRFPHYYGFVWRLSFQAHERQLLVEPAKRALKDLSKIRLPDTSVEFIFNHLSNECLKNLIDVANKRTR